jgi:hypothetical protein
MVFFYKTMAKLLTLYCIDDILSSMRLPEIIIQDRENTALIYSGLGSISGKGREYLKNVAQSLIALQNRPGSPLPDSISREIVRNSRIYSHK